MERKSFLIGLITGCSIAAFITLSVICIYTIAGVMQSEQRERRPYASESTGSAAADVSGSNSSADAGSDEPLMSDRVIGKIDRLEEMIKKNYMGDVSNEDMETGLYRGLLASLGDKYAEYYTVDEVQDMVESTSGIYYGIGAYVAQDPDTMYPYISSVMRGTPAEEAGLRANDFIEKVNDEDMQGMDLDDVVDRIKGEDGTYVHMTIVRGEVGNREEMEFDVMRSRVEVPTVFSEMQEDDIAYIEIGRFDTITVQQFSEALTEMMAEDPKGLILDLRANPGGSLDAVVKIADMLLPEGLVVYTEDKYGKREEYKSTGEEEIEIPMVVLVDGNSASASEILAGAIKDYQKGTLLGTQTYGKGIVQQFFTLPDGSAMKVTVSHYYTPLGNDIHEVGIEPDVVLEWDPEVFEKDGTDNQMEAAMDLLR